MASAEPISRLVRSRSTRSCPVTTPPPLPLISLPPGSEWEQFEAPTLTGFEYTLPHADLEDEEECDSSYLSQDRFVSGYKPSNVCRALSEYMSQNEQECYTRYSRNATELKLVYKRMKPPVKNQSTSKATSVGSTEAILDLEFSAFFESGNLDRAYRVFNKRYLPLEEVSGITSTSRAILDEMSLSKSGSKAQNDTADESYSGNCVQLVDAEYDLYCDNDFGTYGHIQWYFFRVQHDLSNTALRPQSSSRGLRVRFNIRNMLKPASLYNDGMLPAVYIKSPASMRRGWHHAGSQVCYFKNVETYLQRRTGKRKNFYTLSFIYEFPLVNDMNSIEDEGNSNLEVYFAHCYPYTYTRLQQHLLLLQKDPERSKILRRRILCRTLAGNLCDLLTITDFTLGGSRPPSSESDCGGKERRPDAESKDQRSIIIISARVHPGESNSSFVMHGILDFITGPTTEARFLRHHFIFKVVPMLNPDGVIHGNYRCSLAGTDLNRQWKDPSIRRHPTIYAFKSMIDKLRQSREITIFCDLHGHSRKKNIFLYGCKPFDSTSRKEAAKVRLFPHLLQKTSDAKNNGYFSFDDCTFSVKPGKEGTGRVVLWDSMRILYSYTLESSFYGIGSNLKRPNTRNTLEISDSNELNDEFDDRHFMPSDLQAAGKSFCHALTLFSQFIGISAFVPPDDTRRSNSSPPVNDSCSSQDNSTGVSVLERDDHVHISSDTNMKEVNAKYSAPSTNDSVQAGSFSYLSCADRTSSSLSTLTSTSIGVQAKETPGKLDATSNVQRPSLLSPVRDAVTTPSLMNPLSPVIKPFVGCQHSIESPSETSFNNDEASLNSVFSMSEVASLMDGYDPFNLLEEIESSLPEDLAIDDEVDSVGSDSDPSGDDMEEGELEREGSWRHLLNQQTKQKVKETEEGAEAGGEIMPRKPRKLKFERQKLTPQMTFETKEQRPTTPSVILSTSPPLIHQKSLSALKRPKTSLAPIRQERKLVSIQASTMNSFQIPQFDRNREIAALHFHAIQRRSKSTRTLERVTSKSFQVTDN